MLMLSEGHSFITPIILGVCYRLVTIGFLGLFFAARALPEIQSLETGHAHCRRYSQADAQYILNPGGEDSVKDAVVVAIRIYMTF